VSAALRVVPDRIHVVVFRFANRKRLTARECLRHKWLAQQDMDMSYVILSTDKLKKFIIRRKWQVGKTLARDAFCAKK